MRGTRRTTARAARLRALRWRAFHSPDPARGLGADNHSGFADPGLDALIEEAAGRLDPSARLPILQSALARGLEERVWVPLYYSKDVFIVRRPFSLRPRADGQLRYAEVGVAR